MYKVVKKSGKERWVLHKGPEVALTSEKDKLMVVALNELVWIELDCLYIKHRPTYMHIFVQYGTGQYVP